MLRMNSASLGSATAKYLSDKQSDIDKVTTYAGQVSKGKQLWKSKNRTHFRRVRDKLESLCVGKRRCNYCEDSVADEVEHIKPKDLYPEFVFVWDNYLFACGNCNGPKSSRFAVFDAVGGCGWKPLLRVPGRMSDGD